MESALTGFVRVLRNAELRVSPAETLDAARALELVGYADRERLRETLSATLAKTIPEKALFDECFARGVRPLDPPRIRLLRERIAALEAIDDLSQLFDGLCDERHDG